MDTQEISARELRENQAMILNQVLFGGINFIITRHGKEAAVMISPEEFQMLKKFLEQLEDKGDIADARKAIKEAKKKGTKSLKKLAEELDIDV